MDAPVRSWGSETSEETWLESLELAVQAAGRVTTAEQRNRQLEARLTELETRFAEETAALQARLRSAEQALERSEAARTVVEVRLRATEQRAERAEGFIERITTAVRPLSRSSPVQKNGRPRLPDV